MTTITDRAHQAGVEAVNVLEAQAEGKNIRVFGEVMNYLEMPCGFAWVLVKPIHKGNTRLGKEERKELQGMGLTYNDYEKKFQLWVSGYNQSMLKKEAYADAYAKVLREAGFQATSGSRMD